MITDILDCAGGEEYWPTIGMSYLERTTGAIFCFSVNSRPTFDDMGRLHEEMRKRRPDTFPMVMLGLQADMKLDRKVSVGGKQLLFRNRFARLFPRTLTQLITFSINICIEARALAAKWGCEYFEASAKDDVGVKEPIIHLVRLMRDYYVKYPGKNPKKRLDINVWSDKTPLQQDKRGKRPKILRFFGLFK